MQSFVLKFQPPMQEIQNGGGILPEEDSCVISEVVSEAKEDEAKVISVVRCYLRTYIINITGYKF